MSSDRLPEITQAQRDRLAFVELRLRFVGEIRRQDLVARFGIQAAAATRDIAQYKELAPRNLEYDTKGMRDDHHVLSLHASFLQEHSVHAGVISAIQTSLFADASGRNLIQYRPESEVPVVTVAVDTSGEVFLSAWLLYVRQ